MASENAVVSASRTRRLNICADDEARNDKADTAGSDQKTGDYKNGPPDPRFLHECWHKHRSAMWSSHEYQVDRDRFRRADPELQRIVLEIIACIMIGGSVVLDTLECEVFNRITAVETLAMFRDQMARENVHQEVYSKMLDVSHNGAHYRSRDFAELRMHRFTRLAKEYTGGTTDLRTALYFIMVCETIMFAPMFQCICYLATTGYAPKLCDSNLLVMRDGYIHYERARDLLAGLEVKIGRKRARSILSAFESAVLLLMLEIIGDYTSADGLFSYDSVRAHFKHVCHGFMRDNGLYYTLEEELANEKAYGTSPAARYMYLPHLESNSRDERSGTLIYA